MENELKINLNNQEKDLLLQDICARLPYGVILNCCNLVGEKLTAIDENGLINHDYDIDEVKPYLFPLSSMTEEKKYNNPIGLSQMLTILANRDWECITIKHRDLQKLIDWFNKNHLDWRGLIPKGLAIDATGLNIY